MSYGFKDSNKKMKIIMQNRKNVQNLFSKDSLIPGEQFNYSYAS